MFFQEKKKENIIDKEYGHEILKYEVQEHGVVIKGINYTGMIGAFTFSVRIPERINGFKVIEIGEEAFKDSSNLTKVTIPNNVTIINNGAIKQSQDANTNVLKVQEEIRRLLTMMNKE